MSGDMFPGSVTIIVLCNFSTEAPKFHEHFLKTQTPMGVRFWFQTRVDKLRFLKWKLSRYYINL